MDKLFKDFVVVYTEDMKPRLKYNTWLTKEHIIKTKLLSYFGNKKMNEIRAADIVKWQNEMMSFRDEEGNGYSKVYLKTLQLQSINPISVCKERTTLLIQKQKRVIGQFLFRISCVKNWRSILQCFMALSQMIECSRLQRVISITKWSEERRGQY